MIKITEDFCRNVFLESIFQKFIEETGERYANAIKVVFSPNHNNYNDSQERNFNEKRYEQEKNRTRAAGIQYLEGKDESKFKKEFWEYIDDFIKKGDIKENDRDTIKDFLINYIDTMSLGGVKEIRTDKNLNGAVARLDRKPLYHHMKQH